MSDLFSVITYAWRALVSRPAFATIVIACLAIGIAVNTTVFAVFDAILWRPYDFSEPERLAVLRTVPPRGDGDAGLAVETFHDIRREARSLSGVAGVVTRSLTISGSEEPERVEGASISWNLFSMLGKSPQLGRSFTADEDVGAIPTVALLSDAVWQRRFNADSGVIGRTIIVNGSPVEVVGVMPSRFQFPENSQLWVPLGDFGRGEPRDRRYMYTFGRLADGATFQAASAEYDGLVTRLERQAGLERFGWKGRLEPLRDNFIPQEIRLITLTMLGAVTFVLLIACANVANLMLARTTSRQREIAVRTALGAGRGTIVRQLLAESVILALAAGVLSVPLAKFGLRLIDRGIPAGDPIPYYIAWQIDGRVIAYTVVVSILAGLAFGLVPAWQATGGNLQAALKDGGRGSGSGVARSRTRSILVVSEIALALVLLVGASLFVRSFTALRDEGVGFDTAPILTMRTFLQGSAYDSAYARQQRIEDIVRRVEAMPGVTAAAASNLIPLDGGGSWSRAEVRGRAWREEDAPWMWWSGVTAHWAETLGLELVTGRDLTDAESAGRFEVAVVDELLARTLWPGEQALGRQLRMAGDSTLPWFTIVGLVRHYRQGQLGDRDENPSSVFVPLAWSVPRITGLMVRAIGDPATLVASVREQVRASDSQIPLFDVMTMDEVRANGYWQYGLFGWMFGVFGGVALLLAAIGVYGVISYGVTQRTPEFGVRLALGAQRRGVLGMVVLGGLRLAGIGIAIGLAAALGVTQVVRTILVVSPTDPASFIGVGLFLALVAAAASWFPARRATSVDPVIALRSD